MYADTSPTFGALEAKELFFWLFLFWSFFSFFFPLFWPHWHPPLLSAHTVEMWHWLGQPDVTLWKLSFLAEKGWEGVLVVSQSWSSLEEFPFLSSFALAVSQLSFLQISALVPSYHKNTCGSKYSEETLFGTSFSYGISFQAFTTQTFVPASVISP